MREAWLFVRGDESIRIVRVGKKPELLVSGPGSTEHSHSFDTEASLDEFCRWYEAHLVREGWKLHFSMDRRSSAASSPSGRDRRRRGRDNADTDRAE